MKIIILDDHVLFAAGMVKILSEKIDDCEIVCYQTVADLYQAKLDFTIFDLFISDIEIPQENVFELFQHLRQIVPSLPVLVISMHNKLSVLRKCQELGIEGYLLKEDQNIIEAVRAVTYGQSYYSMKAMQTLSSLNEKDKLLSPREEEIITQVTEGKSNEEIANQLFVSVNTIKTHRRNINRKLGVNNTGELIKYYMEHYLR
ncbi:response regulator transcription factor [Reichenbachiella agarivorans]|uniref:Response regulator transcription factor n=1 Tax=Reichenbachiella agarivorans TaxID=2979464 RepID=A0ABY6CZ64_9BACT|nr:response regulator transcription factor [Reichenbachiella agarivorans]UXP33525.1 response regulator transcription factor [Reichenbachiella agarivorans]